MTAKDKFVYQQQKERNRIAKTLVKRIKRFRKLMKKMWKANFINSSYDLLVYENLGYQMESLIICLCSICGYHYEITETSYLDCLDIKKVNCLLKSVYYEYWKDWNKRCLRDIKKGNW